MKNVTTNALIWNADDFDNISYNLRMSDEITEETFLELTKMNLEDKVKLIESYIACNQDRIIELINESIADGIMEDYAMNQ
jgi:hypothetical protein